ncbi:hypothetical protein [uncultured Duncaniella sp.]|uniref:hypothetical protein n=1 Tax=uncultured Duncaniella sp. TaxID=2768039 RepID=UPI002622002E|nr:hypothetical protein [uncultured Duncaniella sp.]
MALSKPPEGFCINHQHVYRPIHVPPDVIKQLDDALAARTQNDINRDIYVPVTLYDIKYKIQICLVFGRYLKEVIEIDDEDGAGTTFEIPAYWLSVPKPLANNYILHLISEYYLQKVNGGKDETPSCPCEQVKPCPPTKPAQPGVCPGPATPSGGTKITYQTV